MADKDGKVLKRKKRETELKNREVGLMGGSNGSIKGGMDGWIERKRRDEYGDSWLRD